MSQTDYAYLCIWCGSVEPRIDLHSNLCPEGCGPREIYVRDQAKTVGARIEVLLADGRMLRGQQTDAEQQITQLTEQVERLMKERDKEKSRRVYYQEIVYAVCNAMGVANGNKPGTGIVCGTVDRPSTEAQQAIASLTQRVKELEAHVAKLQAVTRNDYNDMEQQEAKITQLTERVKELEAHVAKLQAVTRNDYNDMEQQEAKITQLTERVKELERAVQSAVQNAAVIVKEVAR
jgi:DNA repair exonuclease SbcCD ATPase subunit